MKFSKLFQGGPGSGFFGHAGRPGQVGGSASSEGGAESEHMSSKKQFPDWAIESGEKFFAGFGDLGKYEKKFFDKKIGKYCKKLAKSKGEWQFDEKLQKIHDKIAKKYGEKVADRACAILRDASETSVIRDYANGSIHKLQSHVDDLLAGRNSSVAGAYRATQAILKGKTTKVFRGLSVGGKWSDFANKKPGEYIKAKTTASSFSQKESKAKGFGSVILFGEVPAKNVLATWKTNRGFKNYKYEREVLVMSDKYKVLDTEVKGNKTYVHVEFQDMN